MGKAGRPRRPSGRPGRSRHDVPKFGRLVEEEIAKGHKVEQAMEIVRRRQPGLCNSRSMAYELWAKYKIYKANQAEGERRYAQVIAEIGERMSEPGVHRRLRWLAFKTWVAGLLGRR